MKIKNHLLFTQNMAQAIEEVNRVGGHVTHRLTDHVFAATLPDPLLVDQLKKSTTNPPDTLDTISRAVAKAWQKVDAKYHPGYVPHQGIPWDSPGFKPLANASNDKRLKRLRVTDREIPLVGNIAVGLVIVSGPDNYGLNQDESNLVISEVLDGCRFLASQGQVFKLSFTYDLHIITIDAKPTGGCQSYEDCEAIYRDPALKQMGYPPGLAGCRQYVSNLQAAHGANGAFMTFVSKYPLYQNHGGYNWGVVSFISYWCDGWGTGMLNMIFAHETCHAFGACDEYSQSDCTCKCNLNPTIERDHYNCVHCDSVYPHALCLMDRCTGILCKWTKVQIGWTPPKITGTPRMTQTGQDLHLVYRDENGHVILMYFWNGIGWMYMDLVRLLNSTEAKGDPGVGSFQGSQVYVAYRDITDQLICVYYDGAVWYYLNLSDSAGAPKAAGDPFVTQFGTTVHIVYRSVNNEVIDLFGGGKNWTASNLTASLPGSPAAQGNPWPMGLPDLGMMFIAYRDVNDKLSLFTWEGTWRYENLSAGMPGIPGIFGDPQMATMGLYGWHILYQNSGDVIDVFAWNGAWHFANLRTVVSSPSCAGNVAIATVGNNLHVVFRDVDNHISHLYWDGSSWRYDDLNNQAAMATNAKGDPFMMNYQYSYFQVAYRDINDMPAEIYWDASQWRFQLL